MPLLFSWQKGGVYSCEYPNSLASCYCCNRNNSCLYNSSIQTRHNLRTGMHDWCNGSHSEYKLPKYSDYNAVMWRLRKYANKVFTKVRHSTFVSYTYLPLHRTLQASVASLTYLTIKRNFKYKHRGNRKGLPCGRTVCVWNTIWKPSIYFY